MYQDTESVLYRFRYAGIGLLVVACLILFSVFITVTGKNTVFNTKTPQNVPAVDSSSYDTPNAVTASAYYLADGANHVVFRVGTTLYAVSRSITNMTAHSGQAIARAATLTVRGVWYGMATVAHGVASGTIFAVQTPHRIISSMTHVQRVSALIRPADDVAVPTIDAKTSTAEISRLGEQQQQQIKALLAAQLAANKALAGAEVDGSLRHGGYPARWDNAPQDSMLDSWGMYNRECVSYAAWKVNQTFGSMPYWGGIGNANQWVRNARVAGIPTGKTPQVHSVAISMAGYYGHAMWVEAVKGDMIYVSQYNYGLRGRYSEMWVNGRQFTYIYFH